MFIDDLRGVMWRTHSFRALILAIVGLFGPEILLHFTGIEPDPYLRFNLVALAVVYGAVGRLIKQENERFHWLTLVTAGIAILMVWSAYPPTTQTEALAPPVELVEPQEQAGIAPPVKSSEQQFLDIARPLAAKWEGLRTEAYLDPVGIPTVCYGETKNVKLGDRYTKAECDAMLDRRLLEFRKGLHRYFTEDTKATRLPPTRDAAFGSFAYNVGVGGAGGSTAVKRLNAGNIPGACDSLTWWTKAGGKVLFGLVRRRAEERDLCMLGLV